jgi:hypothetical protein
MAGPNAAREVARRLQTIQRRAGTTAPMAAVKALGRAGETATKLTLTKRTHKAGTPTPSAPGQPPALVSGALRRSVYRMPAEPVAPGVALQVMSCHVIYGPVHEFGPVTIRSKGSYPLRNKATGQVFGYKVVIPRRPWMKPSMEALVTSGKATEACAPAFAKAVFSGYI